MPAGSAPCMLSLSFRGSCTARHGGPRRVVAVRGALASLRPLTPRLTHPVGQSWGSGFAPGGDALLGLGPHETEARTRRPRWGLGGTPCGRLRWPRTTGLAYFVSLRLPYVGIAGPPGGPMPTRAESRALRWLGDDAVIGP